MFDLRRSAVPGFCPRGDQMIFLSVLEERSAKLTEGQVIEHVDCQDDAFAEYRGAGSSIAVASGPRPFILPWNFRPPNR